MAGDRQRHRDTAAGFLLIAAAGLALFAANSSGAIHYQSFLHHELGIHLPVIGDLTIHSLVADGLMAIFFFLIGMEIKREWYQGRLSTPEARRLPILAAVAGMIVPALIYIAINGVGEPTTIGWAIPTATDIAFAIGVLALLGRHAPPSIKVLLVAIAIVDDLGAVIIIALFYASGLNAFYLACALVGMGAMAMMNLLEVRKPWPYWAGLCVLWWLVLNSGVHATIAGVLAAVTVPLGKGEAHSTLEHIEHRLQPFVMLGIVPLFGFVSAGVPLSLNLDIILQPLPLGVAIGLFLGKQLGVYGALRGADALGICCRPDNASWLQIYGAALLCGIGFTMSLFIGGLAFGDNQAAVDAAKVGTLTGSAFSALFGYLVLRFASPPMEDGGEDRPDNLFGRQHRH